MRRPPLAMSRNVAHQQGRAIPLTASEAVSGSEQGAGERLGGPALLRGEIAVAAAQRKAVWLPHRLAGDDFEGEVQVPGHPADDLKLLIILQPEVRAVRQSHVEQLGDDRSHPPEVSGTGGARMRSTPASSAIPILFATKSTWDSVAARLPALAREFAAANGFAAKPGECLTLPGEDGKLSYVLFGLEDDGRA